MEAEESDGFIERDYKISSRFHDRNQPIQAGGVTLEHRMARGVAEFMVI